MKFSDLRHGTLSSFVSKSTRGTGFWFFLHVPKTAGSSFSTELATALPKYRNIHVDYSRTDISHTENLKEALHGFLALPDLSDYRSASGHVPFEMALEIKEKIPGTQLITILRSPEHRVISDYRYQRTEMHPPHEQFKRDFPTLESYVESEVSQNKMARFVGGRGAGVAEIISRVDNDFAFAGLLEMYPMSFSVLFELMGFPGRTPREHKRKTPETRDTSVEVTPSILARIRELNRLDVALFDHVRATLLPHREEWRRRLEKRSQELKVTEGAQGVEV